MSWLDEPVTTLALCWRIERRDGVGVGMTAHDRDLMIEGNLYRASPGMTPSAIRRGDPADADTMEIAGALSTAVIAEDDLIGGRWDGARVSIFAVDWAGPGARVALGSGTLGAVETVDGRFSAELRGVGALLDAPACEVTTPECRAELGDRRCRVPMATRRSFATVVSGADETLVLALDASSAEVWSGGRLRWFDGANAGIEERIVTGAGHTLVLANVPRFAVAAGDRVELIEGCDKSLATCATRFGNAVNFRGEPYLPGIDLLTRYPPA